LGIGITPVILVGVLLHIVGLLLGWLAGLGAQGDGASSVMGQTAQQENC